MPRIASTVNLQSNDEYSLISRIYSNQYINEEKASDEQPLTVSLNMHIANHIEDYCDCI